jgi:hypothetical protein
MGLGRSNNAWVFSPSPLKLQIGFWFPSLKVFSYKCSQRFAIGVGSQQYGIHISRVSLLSHIESKQVTLLF